MQKVLVTFPKMSSFQICVLLIVTLCVSWNSAIAAKVCSAERDEWTCESGGCIATENLCDGIRHCRDGSDETKASCKSMQCSFASFRCNYGACISLELLCDGVHDCDDSSDEDSDLCRKRRNNLPNDEIDEETKRKNCIGWGQMKCWSGQCVSITDKCNGVQDCDDGSDELTSLCQTVLCKQHQFQCGYGACLPIEAKCNGTKECWDGTDEHEALCIKEIATILTPTTRVKSNAVTESITYPTIKTKPRISTELANTPKTTTTILDYSTDFEAIENSEKDLTTIPEVKTTSTQTTTNRPVANTEDTETLETHFNGSPSERPHLTTISVNGTLSTQKTSTTKPLIRPLTKANVTRNNAEKNTQLTTPIIAETTTTIYISKQTDSSNTNGQEVSGQIERLPKGPVYHINKTLNDTEKSRNANYPPITTITELKKDTSKAEGNKEDFENHLNSTPSERTQLITTNENATMIARKTSVHSPAAATSVENFGSDQTFKKLSGPTTKENVTKKSSENNLQVTTPKIGNTINTPPIKKNQTFPFDIRNSAPSEQSKDNDNKGQEVRQIQNQLAISQTTLYTLNVTTQTPNLKTKLSSSPNNSNESNLGVQSPINSRPHTGVLPTSPVSHIYKTLNATEKTRNVNYPGSITKTFTNQYNMRKTTPPTTTNKATTKARNQCTLRRCDYPLICNVLLPGSEDSEKLHDKQARQSFFEGSEVVFNCADGYVLEGVNRTTCKANGWSHKIPSCNPSCDADFKLRCKPPLKCVYEEPNISTKHVIRNNFTDTVVREHFKLSFECDAGYLLEGWKIRKCTAKGWSNVMPRCVNQCDVLDLGIPKLPLKCQKFDSNTRLTNNCQYSPWNRKVREGSYFEYSCEYGYNLNGVNRSTCMNDGWNSDAPTCIPWCDLKLIRPCKYPLICKETRTTSFSRITNMAHAATSELTVDFSCEFGYELVGAKVITCSKGGWSHSIPTCKKIYCDASILDDCTFPLKCQRYHFATREYRRINKGSVQQLSQNEYIFISCENGYIFSGSHYLTCKEGKWYGTMPKCIATCRDDLLPKCENPMICTARNYYTGSSQAIINNYSGSYRTYPQGITVVFNCANGHVLNGARTATCDSHGWKYEDGMHDPKCQRISNACDKGILDNCTYPLICEQFDPEFGDYTKIQIATHQKSISNAEQIRFSCENGYDLDGRNTLTCTGGKWDEYMPKCIVHSCRADLLPACKYPLTCTRYDSKFKPEQTIIDNSIYESANYALNTQIVFGCAEDFKLKGEEQTICSANGWSHEQSFKLPECVRISPCDPDIFKSCKRPVFCHYQEPNKNNWSMVQSNFLINYVAENSIVSYSCERGFKPQGANYINCNSEGWDNPTPKCVRV
ncbi:uncharacterized protein LOC126765051 isoform X2 [Bactrocera neohumeralis]|uniref:uncharacterized protein LOC126765051 isoform X2 n=1 Tax=Bactrocera neohumeralis TaxID=98809 RepID=UPI002166028F|nr:uncharacterized protein LOC126765051 isoform X2 [Bactrocera neohumeralis]